MDITTKINKEKNQIDFYGSVAMDVLESAINPADPFGRFVEDLKKQITDAIAVEYIAKHRDDLFKMLEPEKIKESIVEAVAADLTRSISISITPQFKKR